jgi:hypothetical protein
MPTQTISITDSAVPKNARSIQEVSLKDFKDQFPTISRAFCNAAAVGFSPLSI